MVNRRELLQQGGVFAASLPLLAEAAAWSPTIASRTLETRLDSLYKVIYDKRFIESRAFARDAERMGALVHAIEGDITDVWYHDLYPRWRQGAAAIAGLTAHGALFCLERLAWDFRMRVVFREQHAPLRREFEPLIAWVISA